MASTRLEGQNERRTRVRGSAGVSPAAPPWRYVSLVPSGDASSVIEDIYLT